MSSVNSCCSGCDSGIIILGPPNPASQAGFFLLRGFYRVCPQNASDFCKSPTWCFLLVRMRQVMQRFPATFVRTREASLLIAVSRHVKMIGDGGNLFYGTTKHFQWYTLGTDCGLLPCGQGRILRACGWDHI